jgi:acetate---CoA ligase (ADP-forming) subunit alpha
MALPAAGSVMQQVFEPRSVVVVGASRGPGLGRRFIEALQSPGFTGDVYAVNPNADEILGVKCYPSVEAIGKPIDHAIVATPPGAAAAVVADLGRAGVPVAVMFVAGFDELHTAEGDTRASELLAAADAGGVRMIGPNCMGVYSPSVGLAPFPGMGSAVGDTAFISQSGSLMSMFARESGERGFPASKAISVGNQLDLQAADFLRYLGDDESTSVVGMYVEGARDGREFFDALRATAARKPVVLWKSGRTEGGARAARSHTGALTGSRRIWEAVARQTGAIAAKNAEQMIDLVVALHMRPMPSGGRVALVTGPGGPAISAVDALEEAGLSLAELAPETIERLAEEMNAVGTSPRNPVDLGLGGAQESFESCARIVGADAGVDGVVIIGGGGGGDGGRRFAESMVAAQREAGTPFAIASSMGPGVDPEVLRMYSEAGIGVFPTADRAVGAFAGVVGYAQFRREIGAPVGWSATR